MMVLRLLAALLISSTAFDFHIKYVGPSKSHIGEYLSFYGQDVVCEPHPTPDQLVLWRLLPIDVAQNTYEIQNLWRGPSERRYGRYLGWNHNWNGELVSNTGTYGGAGVWQLEPAGDQPNMYKLKNVYHGPSDSRYGLYMGSVAWNSRGYTGYMKLVSGSQAGIWEFITPGTDSALSLTDLQALHETEDATAAANSTKAFNLAENLAPVDTSADRVAAPTEMLVADDGLAVAADRSGYFALAGVAVGALTMGFAVQYKQKKSQILLQD